MSMNNAALIPCREGLWSIPTKPDEKPHLIGSRCPKCGEIFFPVNPVCVHCQHGALDEIKLSRKGKIYTYSTVMLPPPKWYKGKVPFDIGYVQLPEGVRIWTRFLGAEAGTFKIGQEVELDIDVMQVDDEGNNITGYCFIPVKE